MAVRITAMRAAFALERDICAFPSLAQAGIGAAMHDIRLIRDDPDAFDAVLARRGADPVAAAILAMDEERRALTTQLQDAQSRRNEASKAIGKAMGQGDSETRQSTAPTPKE